MMWRPSTAQWRVIRRVAFAGFLIGVAVLLYRHAREVDWATVRQSLTSYTPGVLALAAALAFASHLLYATFDLLARSLVGHGLAIGRTIAIAAVSYAFTLNLGALVGGVGFRYRLYSRYGLEAGDLAQVITFCVVTNWFGYGLLTGAMLAFGQVSVPETWGIGGVASRGLGVVLIAVAVGYAVLCAFRPSRELTVRGKGLRLPSLRYALAQLALSTVNWLLVGAIMYVLLDRQVPYSAVLGATLLAAVAGLVSHIPAGLGVLEAVFVLTLSGSVSSSEIIAALLVFRALYYAAPLLVAFATYMTLEAKAPDEPASVSAP